MVTSKGFCINYRNPTSTSWETTISYVSPSPSDWNNGGKCTLDSIQYNEYYGSMKKMNLYHYHLVFRPEPEGGYTVVVPSLPGCVSYGKTILEAKVMARDAIGAYLESLQKHREPIPTDT